MFLYLDTYDTDTIAINKVCKLYFRYFTMYLRSYKLAAGLSGLVLV